MGNATVLSCGPLFTLPSCLKLVMMVKALGCNEASCVAPGYSITPLGEEEHPSAKLLA